MESGESCMLRQSSLLGFFLGGLLISASALAWAPAGPPGTPLSRNTAGAGAPGVGVAPVPGAAAVPGTPASRNTVGAGAPGVGVTPVPGAAGYRAGPPGTPASRNTVGAGAPGVGVEPVPGAPSHRR